MVTNIDWSDFPCNLCPSYFYTDDCVCKRLNEWSEKQEVHKKVNI